MMPIHKIPSKKWSAFPENETTVLEEIGPYPENNFKYVPSDHSLTVYVFCLYMSRENQKIYHDKRTMSQKYLKHFTDVGKACQSFDFFNPDHLDWNRIKQKFTKSVDESGRSNVDTRTSFKFGNKFLVKSDFTFGQRTVPEGKCHVYQTKEVPLLFYLMPRNNKRLLRRDGFFPLHELQRYDRRILLPNGIYRVPSGVSYVIYTVHKAYFSLDIMTNENFERGMEMYRMKYKQRWSYCDPVVEPVRKLPKDYYEEQPPKTPYIEYEDRDGFEQYFDMKPSEEFAKPADPPQTNDPSPPSEEGPPETPPQIMFYMIPPSVFEKEVVVASPEFVSQYQKLTRKEYGNPKSFFPVQEVGCEKEEPLDLTVKGGFLNELNELEYIGEDMDQSQVDETIKELFASSPFSQINC